MKPRLTVADRCRTLRKELLDEDYTPMEVIEILGTTMAEELRAVGDPSEKVIRRLTALAITEV